MAKLSAYGSRELARFVRVVRDDADGSTHRTTYSVRDDGRVLKRHDGSFRSARYDGKTELIPLRGRWTVAKRFKREAVDAGLTALRARLVGRGFTEEAP